MTGLADRVYRIALVHQYGLKDRSEHGAPEVSYARRRLLGLSDSDLTKSRTTLMEEISATQMTIDTSSHFGTLISILTKSITHISNSKITPGSEHLNDAQILTIKIWRQMCSTRALHDQVERVRIGEIEYEYVDFTSVGILARASVESFLTMHWIYSQPDLNLVNYRHAVWMLGGHKDRLDHRSVGGLEHESQTKSRTATAELIQTIETSDHFNKLSEKQKKLIKSGKWRTEWQWHEEAQRAKFNKSFFNNVYKHLCGFAHSSYISAMQIQSAQDIIIQRKLSSTSISLCCHLLAKTILLHAQIFSIDLNTMLTPEEQFICNVWNFTNEDIQHLYTEK